MIRARAALLVASFVVLLHACATRSDADARDERRDAETLHRALALDPVPAILADVDHAVDEGRAARAAELLETGAVPASRREVERMRAIRMRSDKGRSLAERIGRAYEERVEGLEKYHGALAHGRSDAELLQALDAQRRAEEALSALYQELEAIRPLQKAKRLLPRPNR